MRSPFIPFASTFIIIISIIQFFLPWWVPFLLFFLAGFFFLKDTGKSFLFGLLVGFLIWIGTSVYQDIGSFIPAAQVIADLLGGLSRILVYILTGLLGGIVGGMSAMSGTLLSKIKVSH
jgi:hypothetical protein